jgi:ParB-like chromosome segregation protein Spo0J
MMLADANGKESAMVMANFKTVDPRTLKGHPSNDALFGPADSDLDPQFLESIRIAGILTPLVVRPDNLILSGHRRHAAALRLELKTVPVVVDESDSDLEQTRVWLDSNLQRELTREQKIRFFEQYRKLEAAEAAARQRAGVRQNSSTGRADDLAAKRVGMSRPTAGIGLVVVKEIDKAAATGDHERADKLRTALNEGSVSSAYRMAAQATPDNAEPELDEAADVRTFTPSEADRFRSAYQVMIRTIDRAYGELEQLSFERHGQYVKRLQSLVTDWRADFPDEKLEWL